jgi:hypothetical protein
VRVVGEGTVGARLLQVREREAGIGGQEGRLALTVSSTTSLPQSPRISRARVAILGFRLPCHQAKRACRTEVDGGRITIAFPKLYLILSFGYCFTSVRFL